MAFILNTPPGITDLPDTLLASGALASGFSFSALKENASFGSVVPEVFFGTYSNGQTVSLPISPVDGYQYQQSELLYCWEIYSTLPSAGGQPSSDGALRVCEWYVEQNSGKVHSREGYCVGNAKGGTYTNDGILGVWTIGIRGRIWRSLSAQPSYTDLASSVFAEDNAATQTNLQNLSHNAKLGSVQCEVFAVNPSNAPTWQPGTAYAAGALVQPTQARCNGFWYIAANSGTSGSIEPTWPSIYRDASPITDGSVIWNVAGAGFLDGQQVDFPRSEIDGYQYSSSDVIIPHLAFISTGSMPVQFHSGYIDSSANYPFGWCAKALSQTQPPVPTATTNHNFQTLISRLNADYTTKYTALPPNLQLASGSYIAPAAMALASPLLSPGASTTGVGIVNCGVMYSSGFFNDGNVMVTLFCFRNIGTMTANPNGTPAGGNFTDFSTIAMSTGNPLTGPYMEDINENAKFSILRPEIFDCSYVASGGGQTGYSITSPEIIPGGQVPLPSSPSDGYQYSREELSYLWYFTISAGPYCFQEMVFGIYVDAQSGVINSTVQYIQSGSSTAGTNDANVGIIVYGAGGLLEYNNVNSGLSGAPLFGQPQLRVIIFAQRQHETELQSQVIYSSTPSAAQPSSNNLIPNGGFEIWSTPNPNYAEITGLADDWFVNWDAGAVNTTQAYLTEPVQLFQFPGLNGDPSFGGYQALAQNFSQCIAAIPTCRNNNPPTGNDFTESRQYSPNQNGTATISFVSEIIPIWPGGEYSLSFLASAYATLDHEDPLVGVSPDYIGAGFYARVHLLGQNANGNGQPDMGTDTLFELLCDQPNGASLTVPAGLTAGMNNGYGIFGSGPGITVSPPQCERFDFTFTLPLTGGVNSVPVYGMLSPGNTVTPASSIPSRSFTYQPEFAAFSGDTFGAAKKIAATQYQTNITYNSQNWEFNSNQLRTINVSNGLLLDYVIAFGFGLAVPANATIVGVQVDLNWIGQVAGTGILKNVALYYKGSQIGGVKSLNIYNSNYSTDVVQGGSTDLWGAALTPAILNDPTFGFGVQIEVQEASGTNRSFLNSFTLTVAYEIGTGGGSSSSTVTAPPGNSILCSTGLPATGPETIDFIPAFLYVEFLLWNIAGAGYDHLRVACLDNVILNDLTTGTSTLLGVSNFGDSSGLSSQGNLVGYGGMSFSYSSTDSTITIVWGPFVVLFASGQTLSIQGGSYMIQSGGTGSDPLTASTAYDIAASVNVITGEVENITAWANAIPGGASIIPAAYITQVLNADNHIGLLAGGAGAQAETAATGGNATGSGQGPPPATSPRT